MSNIVSEINKTKAQILKEYQKGYIRIGLCQIGLFLMIIALLGVEFLLPGSPVTVLAQKEEEPEPTADTTQQINGEGFTQEDLDWFAEIDFPDESLYDATPVPTPVPTPQPTETVEPSASPAPTTQPAQTAQPQQEQWTDNSQQQEQWTEPTAEWQEPTQDWNATGSTWTGTILSANLGTIAGPSGKETYYNLPMNGVVNNTKAAGVEGNYWVREDGAKMYGDYILAACDVTGMVHNRYDIVDTSLGAAICADTGLFAADNPYQIDIATTW